MSGRDFAQWWGCGLEGVEVVAGEFVVATPAGADVAAYGPLSALLQRVRQAFGIEAIFVSDWVNGEPLVRGPTPCGAPDTLQAAYGRRLLEADAPARARFRIETIGIVCRRGIAHGTLCCRHPVGTAGGTAAGAPASALPSVARLIAGWFDAGQIPEAP